MQCAIRDALQQRRSAIETVNSKYNNGIDQVVVQASKSADLRAFLSEN